MSDGKDPIIQSLLDLDFYKLTMAQLAWKLHPDVKVKYAFKNRTKGVRLSEIVDEGELRAELEHVRTLRFADDEIAWLRDSEHLKPGFFSEKFLAFLRDLRLPEVSLRKEDGQYVIEAEGRWPEAIWWETIVLSIVNELYCRAVLVDSPDPDPQLAAWKTGAARLGEKTRLLKKHPGVRIIEFGTRRRFCREWQEYVLGALVKQMSGQLVGTSNVRLARKFGLKPVGTMAHEMFMVYSGIYHMDEDEICESHNRVLRDWWGAYGEPLSVALTDTYGSEFFFHDMTREQAFGWRGLRQDSGDPAAFGERAIRFYEGHGIDPKTKIVVFSDGLDADAIVDLHERFKDRIGVSFGWGTNLTNDVGIQPLSLVMKAVKACGHPTVKLSDNPAKATGPAEWVEIFKHIFGAEEGAYRECRY